MFLQCALKRYDFQNRAKLLLFVITSIVEKKKKFLKLANCSLAQPASSSKLIWCHPLNWNPSRCPPGWTHNQLVQQKYCVCLCGCWLNSWYWLGWLESCKVGRRIGSILCKTKRSVHWRTGCCKAMVTNVYMRRFGVLSFWLLTPQTSQVYHRFRVHWMTDGFRKNSKHFGYILE